MDHLQDAKMYVRRAEDNLDVGMMQAHAQLGILHVLIAIAERLTPPETWSARSKRLKEEDRDEL